MQIHMQDREITVKVVYYCPVLSGKTTNLQQLHALIDPDARGNMVTLDTTDDRTLYFDFLPIEFGTENDSELIAVFLAERLSRGVALQDALAESIEELDGTFSFLVSTRDELGYAKDHLAAKPMVKHESEELVAIASEEVSLNRLFPGQTIDITEPLPGTYFTWSK